MKVSGKKDRNRLRKGFEMRMRTLVCEYKDKNKPIEERDLQTKINNKQGRKATVRRMIFLSMWSLTLNLGQTFKQRRQIMESLTALRQFLPVLDKLGVDGVSSDEEDGDVSNMQFQVLEPQWRDSSIGVFFGKVDACYLYVQMDETESGVRFTPGAPPRIRHRKGKKSKNTKCPLRLPFNIYRADWLEEREPGWFKGGQGLVNEIICPSRTRRVLVFPAELDE